ncbi:hypothetical protein HRbin30_02433 [bacterium HR30]|nr:hypothetical protein HRbin30_02433 [bacterium HR30]
MNVEVCQAHVGGILRIDANRRPRAVRIRVALAGQTATMELGAAGMVSELQASNLDIVGVAQVEDLSRPLRTPQLGRVWAARVPPDPENPRWVRWASTVRHRRHHALPGIGRVAQRGLHGVVAHTVASRSDEQGVAAGNPRGATWGSARKG